MKVKFFEPGKGRKRKAREEKREEKGKEERKKLLSTYYVPQINQLILTTTLGGIIMPILQLKVQEKKILTILTPLPTSKSAQITSLAASFQSPNPMSKKRLRVEYFQVEPRWKFEDEYRLEEGSLQTNCPDSVKVKAAQSSWLRELFLPNLTLFLDWEHFNLSEWDRLEHFKPPFGFMGLNYSSEFLKGGVGGIFNNSPLQNLVFQSFLPLLSLGKPFPKTVSSPI
uniref:Uncharacterized protein n=1 Tax=Sarcophilus harrisii TaxID=9305 RepID=A0A7N4PTV3_SARHA